MDTASWAVVQAAGVGDWVGVAGVCITSRTGEPSLAASQVTLLSKALRPLPLPKVYRRTGDEPGEAHTPADADLLWRMPELDMITRRKADLLVWRSRLLAALRQTLQEEYGCIEIETPYLNPHFGGAEARPFTTWVNALGQELFLPVSPEIELKRAVVGGIGSGGSLGRGVYAIARNFRNEALDRTHHPEFTSLEVYLPFVDYETMMEVTERLFAAACRALYGCEQLEADGVRFDFGRPWPRLSMTEAVAAASGIDVVQGSAAEIRRAIQARGLARSHDLDAARAACLDEDRAARAGLLDLLARSGVAATYGDLAAHSAEDLRLLALRHKLHRGIALDQEWDFLVLDLFDRFCEPHLLAPCHVTLHPACSTVLCKEWRGGPLPNGQRVVERFESFVLGMEISNAYSELNDPVVQRRLVEAQAAARQAGDAEAMPHNELFLRSLELGMPPCGGLGIGLDRMLMLLTGARTLREVIAFPLVGRDGS